MKADISPDNPLEDKFLSCNSIISVTERVKKKAYIINKLKGT